MENRKVTQTFADATARGLAIPDAIGQLGVQVDTGVLYISTATTVGSWGIGDGILYTLLAPVGTDANTLEKTLGTYTLPANTLTKNGATITIRTAWLGAANGNTKNFKVYFGSTPITAGAFTTASGQMVIHEFVYRKSLNSQSFYGQLTATDGTTVFSPLGNLAETETAPIIIKATGQNGTAVADDLKLFSMQVLINK